MRQQFILLTLVGAFVAVDNGFRSAAASEGTQEQVSPSDDKIRYEVWLGDTESEYHEVNKQLVEEERKRLQAKATADEQQAEKHRKYLQDMILMQRLVQRALEVKEELESLKERALEVNGLESLKERALGVKGEKEYLKNRKNELLEELSVKSAAIREIYRRHGDGFLDRLLEYLTVDVLLDSAMSVMGLARNLKKFFKLLEEFKSTYEE